MKPLSALLTMALLGTGATACGGSASKTSSATRAPSNAVASGSTPSARGGASSITVRAPTHVISAPQKRPGINDSYDNDDTARRDLEENDDEEVERYGQPASPADAKTATTFAAGYFAAAMARDGARACSLLIPSLAGGIGGSYEKPPNPSYLHGKTCAEVMTKLFEHRHKLVAAEVAGLEVTAVRVASGTARVLLAFKGMRERRYLGLERYGSTWKLGALMDSSYP